MKAAVLQIFDSYLTANKELPSFSDVEGPEFELDEINKAFTKAMTGKKEWSFSSAFSKLSQELESAQEDLQIFRAPDSEDGLEKVALHFEVELFP
jgi:glutaredoxin 2